MLITLMGFSFSLDRSFLPSSSALSHMADTASVVSNAGPSNQGRVGKGRVRGRYENISSGIQSEESAFPPVIILLDHAVSLQLLSIAIAESDPIDVDSDRGVGGGGGLLLPSLPPSLCRCVNNR